MAVFGLETSPNENVAYASGYGAQVHESAKVAWQQRSFGGQTKVALKSGDLEFQGERVSLR
jgi:hypothetical protein